MISGQSLGEAIGNTFANPTALMNIGSSTAMGAITAGVSAGLTAGASAGKTAIVNVATNTIGGAVDAAIKDSAGKAVRGEQQDLGQTLQAAGVGGMSSLVFAGVSEGIILSGTTTTAQITNVLLGKEINTAVNAPNWGTPFGIIGETGIPALIDMLGRPAEDVKPSTPTVEAPSN